MSPQPEMSLPLSLMVLGVGATAGVVDNDQRRKPVGPGDLPLKEHIDPGWSGADDFAVPGCGVVVGGVREDSDHRHQQQHGERGRQR